MPDPWLRKALYYDAVVPPRDWLATAALFWEKVHVEEGQSVLDFLGRFNGDSDAAFFAQLHAETDILEFGLLPVDEERLSVADQSKWSALRNRAIVTLEEFSAEAARNDNDGRRYPPPTYSQWIELLSLQRQISIPQYALPAFTSIDAFTVPGGSSGALSTTLNSRVLVPLQAMLPRNPESLSVERIAEFRSHWAASRRSFQRSSRELLARFEECSTEAQILSFSRDLKDHLQGEISRMKGDCERFRISTTTKVLGLSVTAPSLLMALQSVLGIPFYEPAAIVGVLSLLGADVLATREKLQNEQARDPWGYLLRLEKL